MIRKRFGQHWLKDEYILNNIIKAASLNNYDRVLEIGPGKGSLTSKLLHSSAKHIHAVELDRDLINDLEKRFSSFRNFSLHQGDALSTSLLLPDFLPANKIVANIPYNITGPLIKRLLGVLGEEPEFIYKSLVLLIQKEVADRMLAKTGDSSFSALSVRIQLLAKVSHICDVSPKCFQPPPKVQSKVILIEPFTNETRLDSYIGTNAEKLLRSAFSSRRKKIRNTLGNELQISRLEKIASNIGISLDKRPQEIYPSQWVALANSLSTTSGKLKFKDYG